MKKLFAASLAAALSVSMVFPSLAAVKLATPQVRWSSESEAIPEWTRIDNASGEYKFESYVDGEKAHFTTYRHSVTNKDEWLDHSGFVNHLEKSGVYKFRVMALGDGTDTADSDWSEYSDNWNFKKASVQFGIPTNIHWEGTQACWDAPAIPSEYEQYLEGYELALLGDGDATITYSSIGGLDDTSFNLAEDMNDETVSSYTFQVRAISNTPSVIFHGELSKVSGSYDTESVSDKVASELDKIGTDAGTPIENAPDALKNLGTDLQVAMQTDPDILKKVEDLEAKYAEDGDIKFKQKVTAEDVGIDTNQVKIVGAMLNAAETNSTVSLNIGKPEKEVVVDAMAYKNSLQIDFSLENAVETLKVPVRLTVPIPENVNPDFFHVLHYHNSTQEYEDIMPLEIDAENRTASFTVTRFSTFVLTEEGVDMANIATPSNAEQFKKLADALPEADPDDPSSNPLDSLEGEEKADAEGAVWKLVDALSSQESIQKELNKKDSEDTVFKLSAILNHMGGNQIELSYPDDESITQMMYHSLAFASEFGKVTKIRAELSDVATPANASRRYSFNLDLYKTVDAEGEEKEVELDSLPSPMKFYLPMPEGFSGIRGSYDDISYDEDTNCIVIYTRKLGKFNIILTKESSRPSDGGSGSGGGSSKSTPDIMKQSPAGGKWAKTGDIYRYYFSNGILAQNCWLEINWNNTNHWYYFGNGGDMAVGWLKDNLGNWYYLNPGPDGVYGSMVTGWNLIEGKWYYFTEKSDGFRGTMLSNTTTPDGYTVDADGAWIQ